MEPKRYREERLKKDVVDELDYVNVDILRNELLHSTCYTGSNEYEYALSQLFYDEA